MKTLFCFIIIITAFNINITSQELISKTKAEKIAEVKRNPYFEVTEVEKDIIQIKYTDGNVFKKNIADYKPSLNKPVYSPNFDSTIFDIINIDTILYHQKYTMWKQVNIGDYGRLSFPPIGDVNENGMPEIYGVKKDYYTNFSNPQVMEMNQQEDFVDVFTYDSGYNIRNIYDVDKDGKQEVEIHWIYYFPTSDTTSEGWRQYLFFKKTTAVSLAEELSFVFMPWKDLHQQDNITYGDWDGDDLTDQIFLKIGTYFGINIFEYNPDINNFDSVYQYDLGTGENYHQGFSIGDFDADGYTEFFAGSIHGNVISVENCGDNCYRKNWEGMVETYNAYLFTQTNDLDGNGRKEIWVGGDAFYNGNGVTRITILEANGDDSYEAVGRVDIVGIFSFNARNMQAVDVDKDGKEEILICIDQHVIILKFNGSQHHQSYKLFYLKRNNLFLTEYYAAFFYDFDNDNREEIFISLNKGKLNIGSTLLSYILKPNFTVGGINEENLIKNFHLYSNYPNPFNPSTKIKFDIPERSFVTLKVYNILGKEITTLLEKELTPNNYIIEWEAKDSNNEILPSGVYLIRLTTEKYTHSIKAILIK